MIFGVSMCELEQQPKEYCKMDIGWKIGKCTSRELLLKNKGKEMFEYVIVNLLSIKEMKMILICFGRTLGLHYM